MPTPSAVVRTSQGLVLGTADLNTGSERFAGIPYALPPVGALRFERAVESTAPWPGGLLNATRAGAPCIQNPAGDPRVNGDDSVPPPSEDCLHLTLWRPVPQPARPGSSQLRALEPPGLPVMVYVFGGGLCTGYSNNPLVDGAPLSFGRHVVVVTVSYRLGALGFLPGIPGAFGAAGEAAINRRMATGAGSGARRRGGTEGVRADAHSSGGMNGIYDVVVALRWLQANLPAFGGDPGRVMLFGQSSGSYAVCTLCVSHAARGLFWAAALQSGPCLGGPPGRGWGPVTSISPSEIAHEVMTSLNVSDVHGLRQIRDGSRIQWPARWMNDAALAPYFSGYFVDPAVVTQPPEVLWRAGALVPTALLLGATSKDGTAAFYGTAPTLGNVAPDPPQLGPAFYALKLQAAWGPLAPQVAARYPLSRFNGSAQAAFVQADADAYVICPQLQIARFASAAGAKVWHYEFRHLLPSRVHPRGFGCDNGIELDIVPVPSPGAPASEWATHSADVRFVFGTHLGADSVQAAGGHNQTYCPFTPAESRLSDDMGAYWTALAGTGDPNGGGMAGGSASPAEYWPEYTAEGDRASRVLRAGQGRGTPPPTAVENRIHEEDCAFWEGLWLVASGQPRQRAASSRA